MNALLSMLRVVSWICLLGVTVGVWIRDPRTPHGATDEPGSFLISDEVYRTMGARPMRLDVYQPSDETASGQVVPRHALLAIHGGSWIGGSKSEYGRQFARFTRHGFVVFVPDYTLALPASPSWPTVIEDLRECVRWIRKSAQRFRIDPRRMVVVGSSSGGLLADLLGTYPCADRLDDVSCRVQAVVDLYGPSDLARLMSERKLRRDPVTILIGGSTPDAESHLAEASPITHVTSDDPPMLLIHGSADAWVPPEQSLRMAERLARAGVPHHLINVPGARHGFELMVKFPQSRDLLPEILAFLENVWQVEFQYHY
jgi:acetyl esterase/lipase